MSGQLLDWFRSFSCCSFLLVRPKSYHCSLEYMKIIIRGSRIWRHYRAKAPELLRFLTNRLLILDKIKGFKMLTKRNVDRVLSVLFTSPDSHHTSWVFVKHCFRGFHVRSKYQTHGCWARKCVLRFRKHRSVMMLLFICFKTCSTYFS
jgi:hypothetical protein